MDSDIGQAAGEREWRYFPVLAACLTLERV
jgi:hypothetical protein